LWHRGYPLQLLGKRDYSKKKRKTVHVNVQADFWNGDPDIDAFCRMEHAPECDFDAHVFPMCANKMGPFNSQNTFIGGECLKDFSFLMSDAWTISGPHSICRPKVTAPCGIRHPYISGEMYTT
jgi:hypothetical protein